jgi:hypothetical protein
MTEQPIDPKTWRAHPRLKGKFQPDFPDDLQVMIHDGGPYVSDKGFEVVWVTITGVENDVFRGRALNQPVSCASVKLGDTIQFIVPTGGEYPLLVTGQYLRERPGWNITPCDNCGLSDLFDPPSVLIKINFPDLPPGAVTEAFTTTCGVCGGKQVVVQRTS